MSTAWMIKVSARCPTFDGTDYPYWKNKMRMHLEAIDNDLWYVVENGVPSVSPSLNATYPSLVMMNLVMNLDPAMSNLLPFPLNNKDLWKKFTTC